MDLARHEAVEGDDPQPVEFTDGGAALGYEELPRSAAGLVVVAGPQDRLEGGALVVVADAEDGGRVPTARVRLDCSKGVTVALKRAVIRNVAANDHHVDLGQVTAVVQKSRQHRAGVDAVSSGRAAAGR